MSRQQAFEMRYVEDHLGKYFSQIQVVFLLLLIHLRFSGNTKGIPSLSESSQRVNQPYKLSPKYHIFKTVRTSSKSSQSQRVKQVYKTLLTNSKSSDTIFYDRIYFFLCYVMKDFVPFSPAIPKRRKNPSIPLSSQSHQHFSSIFALISFQRKSCRHTALGKKFDLEFYQLSA